MNNREIRKIALTANCLALFKVPINSKSATTLAALLIQYPEHRFEVSEDHLILWRA